MLNSPQAYVLTGPTASGKSALVQCFAEKTGAPVVSADSMNIYRGMDIGTAKPPAAERTGISYYGIDIVSPEQNFSVGDWLNAVCPAFENAVPVVTGGTGLYVKCLLQGLDIFSGADETLRARAGKMTRAELQNEVRIAAPEQYEQLADKTNPRRLIRLLEQSQRRRDVPVASTMKENATETPRLHALWQKNPLPKIIGLHVERAELHRRIAARVETMYTAGLLAEAEALMKIELSSTAQHAIGYAEAFAVLRGEMHVNEAKEKTIIRTRQLAKRQMTWFRHQLNVDWIDAAAPPEKVFELLKKNGAVECRGVRE